MSKKLLALLLAMIMVIGSFTSVLAEGETKPAAKEETKPAATETKPEEKKEEAKPEEKKDEAKPAEKTEEKKEEKKEDPALTRAIDVLKKAGYISGFSKETEDFKAEQNVTRAQFASMIVRVKGSEKAAEMLKSAPTGFTDVPVTHWANGYIAIAKNAGYVNGYPDGSFKPEGQITYAEMATMLTIALGKNEAGDRFPQSYIMKAQQLGLFKDVEGVNFSDMATRGDVFKMVYNMITNKEFANRKILKAIVLENDRVENLGEREVTVEVIDVVQKADWVGASRDKKGDNHTYKLDKDLMLDPENLLGKVVDVTVDQNDKVVEIKVDDSYKYVEGKIQFVGAKKFEINHNVYTASLDERYDDTDERIFRTYLNDKAYSYREFADKYKGSKYDFARATIKNGKVIFIDAYQFDDVAPVTEVKGGDVYYLDDSWNASVAKAKDLADRVVFKDAKGYVVANKKDIVKDDVIHFYNNYENAIVRKDAKVDTKLVRTYVDRDNREFAVGEKADYLLRYADKFRGIYSFEGKKFFVIKERLDLKPLVGDKVKVLVALDGSVQLVEGTKPWDDGVNAIYQVTSYGDVRFLPPTGEKFWAKETRNTEYYDSSVNNRALYNNFNVYDIVYLARGEKEDEIDKMFRVLPFYVYSDARNLHSAKMTSRIIRTNGVQYRYFENLHAYALTDDNELVQVGELSKFIEDNKDNDKLQAYVMSEASLKRALGANIKTYNFLSTADDIASVVVFKGAIVKVPGTKKVVEVIRKYINTNALLVKDQNGNEFELSLEKNKQAVDEREYETGDIVEVTIRKDSADKDVKVGYVSEALITGNLNAAWYDIDDGKYRNTFVVGGRTYNYDSDIVIFNNRDTRKAQIVLDKNGWITVMRFKPSYDKGSVYFDRVDSASSSDRDGALALTSGTARSFFFVDARTEFYDENGFSLGRGTFGLKNLITGYDKAEVKYSLSYNSRVLSRVDVLRKETTIEKDIAAKAVKDAVAVLNKVKFDAQPNKTGSNATKATDVEAAFKKVADKALADAGITNVTTTAKASAFPAGAVDDDAKDGIVTIAVTPTVGDTTVTSTTLKLDVVNKYHVNSKDEETKAQDKKDKEEARELEVKVAQEKADLADLKNIKLAKVTMDEEPKSSGKYNQGQFEKKLAKLLEGYKALDADKLTVTSFTDNGNGTYKVEYKYEFADHNKLPKSSPKAHEEVYEVAGELVAAK